MIDIKYKNIYDKFIEHYKLVHVNPWHEISELELGNLYEELTNSMDIKDRYTFKYFIDYIIKRLSGKSDAHTKYDSTFLIPLNFRIIEDEVFINYPNELKGASVLSINGININEIIEELEDVITYGTEGKKRHELEKSLFNKFVLFGLPSLRCEEELVFKVRKLNGEVITKRFSKQEHYLENELFNLDEYYYGNNATYQFIDDCLVYKHSSSQNKFKSKIEDSIKKLRQEDLKYINTIIIDIRGNTGGNSELNKMIMEFVKENSDKNLICLTDYRVFSAGRYALRDLLDLKAITIGEEISTPMNCYGNNNWVNINDHFFSVSEYYFNPIMRWSVKDKEGFSNEATPELLRPCIFKPDVLVLENKEDYINGIDTILERALNYSKELKQKRR